MFYVKAKEYLIQSLRSRVLGETVCILKIDDQDPAVSKSVKIALATDIIHAVIILEAANDLLIRKWFNGTYRFW